MNLRKLLIAPAVALVASFFVTVSPASADPGNPFDVYNVTATSLRAHSGSCRYLPITANHNGTNLEDIYGSTEIWRNGQYLSETSVTDAGPGTLTANYLWCPYLDGLGKFRVGPTNISYATTDYNYTGNFIDSTNGTFTVYQDSRVSNIKAVRAGKKRTLTGKATFYSVSAARWASSPKGTKLRLQRETTRGSWRTVKSARVTKGGKFKVAASASKAARYRVVVSGGSQTWPATSRVVSK